MKVYAINNLEKYAAEIRLYAANSISEEYSDNLDEYITLTQVQKLIKEKSHGVDQNNNLLIYDDLIDEVFYTTCDWIYGVGLSKLASKNLVECAWDDEKNCMVFWVNKNGDTDESAQQPNTRNFESD